MTLSILLISILFQVNAFSANAESKSEVSVKKESRYRAKLEENQLGRYRGLIYAMSDVSFELFDLEEDLCSFRKRYAFEENNEEYEFHKYFEYFINKQEIEVGLMKEYDMEYNGFEQPGLVESIFAIILNQDIKQFETPDQSGCLFNGAYRCTNVYFKGDHFLCHSEDFGDQKISLNGLPIDNEVILCEKEYVEELADTVQKEIKKSISYADSKKLSITQKYEENWTSGYSKTCSYFVNDVFNEKGQAMKPRMGECAKITLSQKGFTCHSSLAGNDKKFFFQAPVQEVTID